MQTATACSKQYKIFSLIQLYLNYFALLFRNSICQILITMQLQHFVRKLNLKKKNKKKGKERLGDFFFFLHTIPALKWSHWNSHVCSPRSSHPGEDWLKGTRREVKEFLWICQAPQAAPGRSSQQTEPWLCPYVVAPGGASKSLCWDMGSVKWSFCRLPTQVCVRVCKRMCRRKALKE